MRSSYPSFYLNKTLYIHFNMKPAFIRHTFVSILLSLIVTSLSAQTIDLSGEWNFSMGEVPVYNDVITLPGSMVTEGKGDDVTVNTVWTGSTYDSSYYYNPYMEKYRRPGNVKFPFFLTPEKNYIGHAWYQRDVVVPRSWRKRKVTLSLERPHIETTVYVNGNRVGHQMSLSVPHEYDLTPYIRFGKSNEIAIQVYNGIENVCVGQDSHSVTDQTQGNWNGIAGRVQLLARPVINKLRVTPNVSAKKVCVEINDEKFHFPLGDDGRWWDEYHPNLYKRVVDYHGYPVEVTFGLRDIKTDGRQICLNGRPIWMRGTVENCCFPETGYPPTDVESWMKVLGKCKEYGLNHVRFHSYCPPEAAFEAADVLGMYLQPEGPSWPNHGVRLRRGQSIDQYLLDECKRIVDRYGHHPSFVMMAAGNEPAGDWVAWCNDFVKEMRQYDPSKIYCGASVGGGWAWDDGSQYHVKGGARGLDWDRHAPHADDDYYDQLLFPRNYRDSVPNQTPIIAHEQGQWCAFPDLKETGQYTGAYKAKNFEIFSDLLYDNGMGEQAEKFLHASGRLQVLAYKYEMERNLRTRDYTGFQLLSLNDYSGQGTALVGPLNVHWREKGYTTAQEWRTFCSSVVPLAKWPRFIYRSDERLDVPVELYNASDVVIKDATCRYRVEGDRLRFEGRLCQGDLPRGKNIALGNIQMDLAAVKTPACLKVVVEVVEGDEVKAHNDWNIWVYPAELKPQDESRIYITDSLDERAIQVLANGGKVLVTAAGKVRYGNDVSHHYLPVFWNTSWFKMRPPHTTGAYIQQRHPVFSEFPTDDWQNLNWWELVNRAQVMNLSEFPKDYQPIVQPIDTWHVSRKLGLLVEANVLNGQLMMTTMDISSDLNRRVVARQLRHSIIKYMDSDQFHPTLTLPLETLRHIFEQTAPPVNMFTKESPDELKPKINGF